MGARGKQAQLAQANGSKFNLLLMLVAQMSTYPRAIATHYCSWGSTKFKPTHGALTAFEDLGVVAVAVPRRARRCFSARLLGIRATKLPIGQLKLISSPMGNLVFYGHFARSHGLHGPTRHPTAGDRRQNDQKRPSCAHGRSANSRYAIQAAKGGHMSRLVRWS